VSLEAGADAVVIGAGVIGSAVALELARGGRSVVVLDAGPAPGSGSTSASSSIIRFSYSTYDAVLTAWEAAAAWTDWAGFLGGDDPDGMARFIRTGMVVVRTPGDNTDRIARLWDDIGITYHWLDAEGLQRMMPGVDAGAYHPPSRPEDPRFVADAAGPLSALFEPESGFIDDPALAARNLAGAARRHGAVVRLRTRVTGVEVARGRIAGVCLDGGEVLRAPVVVNAAGPHSALVSAMVGEDLGMRLGHRPLRQEVFIVPAPTGLRLEDGMPTLADMDIGQYLRPQVGGTWLVGGTEPECDELHWVDDPDTMEPYPTVEQYETSMLRLAKRMPAFGVPHRMAGLAALYDVADDWVPFYDRTDVPGFYLACGTSGNQFKNAPMAGRFLAAIIDHEAVGGNHDEQPVQVVGARTGRPIDLAAFSRRRDPAATSGTVMG